MNDCQGKSRYLSKVRDFLGLLGLLFFISTLLSVRCYAGGGAVSEEVTFGPDNYLENKLNLSLDLTDSVYSSIGYSSSQDKNTEGADKAYSFSLGHDFNDISSGQINYAISP
ncbi:MAG: hypothetical protein V1653_00145, partial [bacterium]